MINPRQSKPVLTILALLTIAAMQAGTIAGEPQKAADSKDSKDVKVEIPPPKSEWELKLAVPGWLAGISGDVGVRGINTHVSVDPGTILRKLDLTASFAGELRKGRFGVYADFLYLNLSDSGPNTGLVGGGAVRFDQYTADFDVNYRIVEGPRGWVDALAGFRFQSISQQLTLYPNGPAINQASTNLVNAVGANILADVKSEVSAALDSKLAALQHPDNSLPVGPLAGYVRDQINDQVTQILQSKQAALAAAIAAHDFVTINAIKADLSQRIANTISGAVATPQSRTDDWVDPYVGFRARLNLYKEVLYLTAKTDVGGFGAGSKISVEAYGALGCQITRSIYAEAGYKYLYVDYDSGGFLYKTASQGAEVTVGLKF